MCEVTRPDVHEDLLSLERTAQTETRMTLANNDIDASRRFNNSRRVEQRSRARVKLTPKQLTKLEGYFRSNEYPRPEMKADYADDLGIGFHNVSVCTRLSIWCTC